ncbi:MAG: transcriptional regulator FtsR [Solirubrobacterales bacterium]
MERTTAVPPSRPDADGQPGRAKPSRPRKAMTIGSVCKILSQEFSDISISKIRYLEDQKLLTPRRTPGGYRLYSQDDVDRLRTILQLQRDEFLPLRVIRRELASGDYTQPHPEQRSSSGPVRRAISVETEGMDLTRQQLLEQSGVDEQVLRELEEYGIVVASKTPDGMLYTDTDREVLRAVGELARFGVAGRNLRVFKSSADREARLLEQIFGPALRSHSADRRREAVENLENLAAVASRLQHLLLVRTLRGITG